MKKKPAKPLRDFLAASKAFFDAFGKGLGITPAEAQGRWLDHAHAMSSIERYDFISDGADAGAKLAEDLNRDAAALK